MLGVLMVIKDTESGGYSSYDMFGCALSGSYGFSARTLLLRNGGAYTVSSMPPRIQCILACNISFAKAC